MEVAKHVATVNKEVKHKVYSIAKEVGANDKCPPQALVIIAAIKALGGVDGKTVKREDLITALKQPIEKGGLKTNQTPERIVGFYKPKLIEMGVLKESTETTTVQVEVADKPAKAEKPAGDATTAPVEKKTEKGKKGEAKGAA